jgi:hypothetical protein
MTRTFCRLYLKEDTELVERGNFFRKSGQARALTSRLAVARLLPLNGHRGDQPCLKSLVPILIATVRLNPVRAYPKRAKTIAASSAPLVRAPASKIASAATQIASERTRHSNKL